MSLPFQALSPTFQTLGSDFSSELQQWEMLRDSSSKENLDSAVEFWEEIPTAFTEPGKTKPRQREARKDWHHPFTLEFTLVSVRERTGTALSAGKITGMKLRRRGGTSITHQGRNSEFQGEFRSWDWVRDLHSVLSPHRTPSYSSDFSFRQNFVAFEQQGLCQAEFNSWWR